jgi:hypothetical protein
MALALNLPPTGLCVKANSRWVSRDADLRLAGAVLAGQETEVGCELMRVAGTFGVIDGDEEDGDRGRPEAGARAQARHARILAGELLDHRVRVGDLRLRWRKTASSGARGESKRPVMDKARTRSMNPFPLPEGTS